MALVEKVYLINEKHKHNSVKSKYLSVKRVTCAKISFRVLYCDICKKFLCPVSKYESEYKGKIRDNLFVSNEETSFIKDTSFISNELGNICINELENFKKEHLDHNICERTLTYKGETFKLAYCIDCDSYGVNFQYYYNIKNNKNLTDVYVDSKTLNLNPENNLNDNIECLIRINTFRCNIRKHNIEEVIAIVNVFKKNTNKSEQVEINAFYCKNCKLYFIYESEYEKLLKHGIPTCPIHEELKCFNKSSDFESYNTESLLRQFGYNVNAQENLSVLERRRIIETILEHGFMTKNEILSHLSFLSNSRKNLPSMLNAVSKWNDDINYVNTLKGPDKRIVIIGAFRKFISKEK